jgi:hypothetical protein
MAVIWRVDGGLKRRAIQTVGGPRWEIADDGVVRGGGSYCVCGSMLSRMMVGCDGVLSVARRYRGVIR